MDEVAEQTIDLLIWCVAVRSSDKLCIDLVLVLRCSSIVFPIVAIKPKSGDRHA